MDKGKKPNTSVGLVPDVIGGKETEEAFELMQAWGKVCEHIVLFFFDQGDRANFLSQKRW